MEPEEAEYIYQPSVNDKLIDEHRRPYRTTEVTDDEVRLQPIKLLPARVGFEDDGEAFWISRSVVTDKTKFHDIESIGPDKP